LRIVQAIEFPSSSAVTFAGQTAQITGVTDPVFRTTAPSPLVAQLQQLLYDSCYCHRFNGAVAPAPKSSTDADPGFIESLSAANASRDRWDQGWQILQILQTGQIVTVKGAITRTVWPGEFITDGAPGVPPRPGAAIRLFATRESRDLQPGFYFAFGETLTDQEDEFSIVRLYWHVHASGASRLINSLTESLNRFTIPFRFKCLSFPALYDRTDAAVLYIAKRYYRIVANLLVKIYPTARPFLKSGTPLFTKSLAHGLGLAESPKTGESFGMSRCRMVAQAACDSHLRGADTPEERLSEVAKAFAEVGISLDRPFLNPRSVDQYEFRESCAK